MHFSDIPDDADNRHQCNRLKPLADRGVGMHQFCQTLIRLTQINQRANCTNQPEDQMPAPSQPEQQRGRQQIGGIADRMALAPQVGLAITTGIEKVLTLERPQ